MSIRQWPEKSSKFFKEVKLEMQKVSWPSRESVVGSTIIVLIVTAFLSVFMWGADYIFGRLLNAIIS